jgi:hypothetical protein
MMSNLVFVTTVVGAIILAAHRLMFVVFSPDACWTVC